ncbi:MAG: hypothetical protein J1G06_09040 [Oscillospiraceae bacterium]|nr:hypothetical protein [Oscillospiraceae bacterium]
MQKPFINVIASTLTAVALTFPVNIACVSAADSENVTGTNISEASYLTPFESRYDLTSNHLIVDDLNFNGVKEVNTNSEAEEYMQACVDRGYHYVFFRASSGVKFDLNSFMNKNEITYVVIYTITRSGKTYTGYEFTYTYSYDILKAVAAGKESTLNTKQQQVLKVAKDFIASLPAEMTDYDKELAIHNYVCEKLSYMNDNKLENITDCYGGLILGRGNCTAYTDSFNLLCGLVGLDTGRVICTVNGGAHALNYINIDGEYYFVDCTFDDGIDSSIGYGLFYFNMPYSAITKTHNLPNLPFVPTEGTNSYGYYQRNGMYADSPDELMRLYKQLADTAGTGEILFNTANGNASLSDMFHEYPAGKTTISTSICTIGQYKILKFTLN